MFPDCILVSVTGPQNHLAWAQALSFPTHKRERSHKRAERSVPFAGRVESKGGTMDFISIQQLVRTQGRLLVLTGNSTQGAGTQTLWPE